MFFIDFMNENFPNLNLRPPIFYNWEIGIRFELGVEWDSEYINEKSPYVLGVYKRAITLFESIHSQDEEIFVVIDVNSFECLTSDFGIKAGDVVNIQAGVKH